MKKILFLTNVQRRYTMMQRVMNKMKSLQNIGEACECFFITKDMEWSENWRRKLQDADIVYMKWMGDSIETPFCTQLLKLLKEVNTPFYIEASEAVQGDVVQYIPEDIIRSILLYAQYGGEKNYEVLWQCLNQYEEGISELPPPSPLCWTGIYQPDVKEPFLSLEVYRQKYIDPEKPTVGFLFYRDEWVWRELEYHDVFIREAEKQGLNVVAVFSNGMPDVKLGMPTLQEVFSDFMSEQGVPCIDVLFTNIKFSMTATKSVDIPFFNIWNIPVIQGYSLLVNRDNWESSYEGMTPTEVSISVALPEFDGVIHGLPISTKEILAEGEAVYTPLSERIEATVRKLKKWASLHYLDNQQKKVAIIFHNYPPSNANIGSAVGLDTMESVRRLLVDMQARGYEVGAIPEDGQTFLKTLVANATNDIDILGETQLREAEALPCDTYIKFFKSLPSRVQLEMSKQWGEPPGQVMVWENSLLVPGTHYGNVFVTVQPPRGYGADPEAVYHSPLVPPTHQYLAFYEWLRCSFKADIVAHIGTHGSLEWLPGKNAGLGNTCYPDIALGELPNVYPYLMTITGEGTQAKRRSSACLVEHIPAPQEHAGLYGGVDELERLMDEYLHFIQLNSESAATIEPLVEEQIKRLHLEDDLPQQEAENFVAYLGRLHAYLGELKHSVVHTGLHILGEIPTGTYLKHYVQLIARYANGEIPGLYEVLAKGYDQSYIDLLENGAAWLSCIEMTKAKLVAQLEKEADVYITFLCEIGTTLSENEKKVQLIQGYEKIAAMQKEISHEATKGTLHDATWQEAMIQIGLYILNQVLPAIKGTGAERTNMLRAFEGQYVAPGPSGAPTSGGGDLLPSGRNFYSIDPRVMPTRAAWLLGKKMADQVIERFILEEGHYPESVGMVLWSGSSLRTHGQCVAQFLYLLGIKPIWQAGSGRVIGLEVMPLTELERPRIDVTARISGLFRDTVPNLAELLHKAVLQIAALEETVEQNFVRKHVMAESGELRQEGLCDEEAWAEAAYRVFGCPPGTYGAGINNLLDNKNWETLADISAVYVRWGAHAYGGKCKGSYKPQRFERRLATLDITLQNQDQQDTNLLSTDDYNAYHGGMIAAVKHLSGKVPRSYCGDSSNRERTVLRSVQEETKRVFRSECMNPKFIEGMMKHGYKGAMDMSKYVMHSYQWDATSAVMEDWMYEGFAEKYALDPEVQAWMRDVNPWALKQMVETLLEAQQRGLWNTRDDMLEQLREVYLSVEGDVEAGSF